jgi:hypothetical protein
MKKWTKIFKLKKYDVALLRMCNDDEGEHVVLILRIQNGQYIKTATFGEDKESADEFFDKYEKKHAEEFVKEFEKLITEGE